ncbi:ricin-type beta-trefoil lectin domain protein [Lysobacter firmicutimachus]|uniref:Ricin-type beta-trefoil lectin domain protein n=1 Tax=Lysobacter firmicutimachus TaxID=1792846 RepID=A0AAU8N0I0_9GAMM
MKIVESIRRLGALMLLSLLSLSASAGDTPGSYTHYAFDPSITGLNSVDFGITVETDPGYRANVYWSNQFSFVGTPSGGYTGMQSNGGNARMFLFSVWDATEAKPGSTGSYCLSFGGEGVGKSCRMAYEWTAGHTYRFRVANEGNRWFGVTVTDLTTGGSFKLGSIRAASDQISPKGMINWTEYFEWNWSTSNCYNQPYSDAEFLLPIGNGGTTVASVSGTKISAPCASRVDITPVGSVQVNAIGNSLRGRVVSANNLCIDAKGSATTNNVPALGYSCHNGENQAWVHGVDRSLRLQSNLCLDVASNRTAPGSPVIVYSCHGGRNQLWNAVGNQLRNDLSGLCLTASTAGAQLTIQTCGTQSGQNWTVPRPAP